MIDKFQGAEGKRRLLAVLQRQKIVQNSSEIAEALAEQATLVHIEAESDEAIFITENGQEDDIYLILTGRVSVRVNGREIAVRGQGEHVGEMAAIDPSQRRSASVVAIEPTVMAKFSETIFTVLANDHPNLWRQIALELSNRLRERGKLVPAKNSEPHIFIGSTVEALSVARAIQSCLHHDDFKTRIWTDGVFRASSTAIDDLLKEARKSDFAILVLTAEDVSISREIEKKAPRDNCIFELGLFMGVLGKDRTFILRPRGEDIKVPTDLLGLTPLDYKKGKDEDMPANLGPACDSIRKIINSLGPK